MLINDDALRGDQERLHIILQSFIHLKNIYAAYFQLVLLLDARQVNEKT